MVTAEELVVAIKSEGVGDTREDVEAVGDSMEQTAEESGDAAEELTGFSEDIAGAASAAVAGLALITGGLLSQIPILGEFAAGLGAILSAIGLQVDQLIRDLGGGGLTQVLFDIANGIMNLEGAAADLAGVLGVVLTAVTGAAAGLAAWAIKAKGVIGAASALVGVLKTVGATIAGVVAGVSSLTAGLAVAAAAVIGLLVAILTNFRGARDKFAAIVLTIRDTVVNGFTALKQGAIQALGGFAGGVGSTLKSVAARFASWAGDLASRAFEWGTNLINSFLNGIRSAIGRVRSFLGDLRDIGGNIGVSVPSLGGGGGGGGAGRARRLPSSGTGGGGDTTLDGRTLTESTGRYRSDPANRRGL